MRTVYRPRGLVISTGEQLPDTQSLVARLVTVETTKGDVHLGKLSEAQDERARYPHAMAGYIAWLWDQWDHFSAVPPDSWRELRTKTRPSLYFLTILGELLTQKKAHLLPILGSGTPGEGDLLGWYDDGYYFTCCRRKNNRGSPLQKWSHWAQNPVPNVPTLRGEGVGVFP